MHVFLSSTADQIGWWSVLGANGTQHGGFAVTVISLIGFAAVHRRVLTAIPFILGIALGIAMLAVAVGDMHQLQDEWAASVAEHLETDCGILIDSADLSMPNFGETMTVNGRRDTSTVAISLTAGANDVLLIQHANGRPLECVEAAS